MTLIKFASSTVWLSTLMSFGAGSLSLLCGQPITEALICQAPLPLDACGVAITKIEETNPTLCQMDIEKRVAPKGTSPKSSLPPMRNQEDKEHPAADQTPENKRMFSVLPNYRMAEGSDPF